jgi:hypothetical protein
LAEIKRAHTTFDAAETPQKEFGACVLDYERVRTRANAKFDILSRFGMKLDHAMKGTHAPTFKASRRAMT